MTADFGSTIQGGRAALVALDLVVRATALLAVAFACHFALGRPRALLRSALWNACLMGLMLLPGASLVFPRLRVPVAPAAMVLPTVVPPEQVVSALNIPVSMIDVPYEISPGASRTLKGNAALPLEPVRAVETAAPAARQPGSLDLSRFLAAGINLAFAVYLAIAVTLAIRLAVGLAKIERLRRRSVAVEDTRWVEALGRWRARLGISRRVTLLSSNRVSIPIVVSWLRPAIIVPDALRDTTKTPLIDAVLLHELAHVRRSDFAWNVVRKLVQLLYWPHPLVWLAGRTVGAVREQACDDLCVHGLGSAEVYRASLIEIASELIRRPGPALGMAMAHSPKLGRRLAWIDRTRGASRCLLHWPARLALALLVACAAGVLGSLELARAQTKPPERGAQPAERPQAGDIPTAPKLIEVIVRAKDTGKPLADARVETSIDMVHALHKTDRDGRARIVFLPRISRDAFGFDVWAEGYVQQRRFFAQHDARTPKIPAQVTVELLPGEQTLGGTVTDEQGRPVGGVKVAIWGYLGEKKQKDELAYMVDATTDERGQWRCRCFRNMQFAYLYLSHPDYLADDSSHPRRHGRPRPSDKPQPDEKPMAALRDFSDVQVMARGVEVAGDVKDEKGRPIPEADVGWLEAERHDTFYFDMPTTTTDAAGRFRFPHVRPGTLILQIKAQGHSPELKRLEAKEKGEPVSIVLGPARTLAGRVVDSKGRPIAGAFVVIDAWRTYRSLGVYLESDDDGRFRWQDAPLDSVLINASKTGFDSVLQQRVGPDEEAILTLKRSLAISGRIRDSKTKKAIDNVTVDFGTPGSNPGAFNWARNNRVFSHQGYLQASVDVERTPEFQLRFRAKGYEPLESRSFRGDELQVEYNVELTPTDKLQGTVVAGTVRRPDGKPLAGTEVAVTYPMTGGPERLPSVSIENGKLQANPLLTVSRTDAEGRFSLTREPDPVGQYFAVVLVHPEFFAEASRDAFEANPTIEAKPWGRVEGVARIGSKPAAGELIRYFADRLGNPDVPHVSDGGETKADAEGRFVLERVVPGDVRVARGFGERRSARAWSNGVLLDVRPGDTARAEIGGKGRPVVARIALPPGFDPKGDYPAHSQFEIESDRPNIPYPKALLAKRDGSLIGWGKRWWASAEGHEYRRRFFRLGQAKLQPDGTLRAEDVPPGDYRLNLIYSGDALRGIYSSPERIAYATKQFTIPEMPGGRADEPYDLGVLRPRRKQVLTVGQAAPPFDVETLDGRRLKLEDFRGKFLLIDFWATWCGPCIAEIPELKAVHDRFGKDVRFAMLSLSADAEKEAPRKFVADKGIAWMQGFVGEWVEGGVQDAYHVEAIPAIFLIGPDGKLRAKGLRGASIEGAVAQALSQR